MDIQQAQVPVANIDGIEGFLTNLHISRIQFNYGGRVIRWEIETTLDDTALQAAFQSYVIRKPGGSLKLKRFCSYAESKSELVPGLICRPYNPDEVAS